MTVVSSTTSLEALAAELSLQWPERKQQIWQLLRLVGRPTSTGTDVCVHGALKSGKTSVVRALLARLGRQHAYFALGETTKPKQLFSSLLTQLKASKRRREGGYVGCTCGDSVADFAAELSTVYIPGRDMAYIVLDGVQLVARSQLLQGLLSAREVSGAHVAFIFISPVPLASQWFFEGLLPRAIMPQVYFPAYTQQELQDILSRELLRMLPRTPPAPPGGAPPRDPVPAAASSLVRGFLDCVVLNQRFTHVTRSVPELRAVAAHLWPLYLKPLADPLSVAAAAAARQDDQALACALMGRAMKEHIDLALSVLQPGMSHPQQIAAAAAAEALARQERSRMGGTLPRTAQQQDDSQTQHEHEWGGLPLSAKLLLVAAFLASHNKASQDKQVFEAGKSATVRRRKGAQVAQAADRQAEAAKDAKLRGPAPFTLARLLGVHLHLHCAAQHTGATHHAAAHLLQRQGLPSLRASFVLDGASLEALSQADQLHQVGGAHAHGPHQHAAGGVGSVPATVPLPMTDAMLLHRGGGGELGLAGTLGPGGPGRTLLEDEADEAALTEAFTQETARQKGSKGRQKQQAARRAAGPLAPSSGGAAPEGVDGQSASARGAAWQLEPDTFHLPHPASGCPRHGAQHLAPHPASLMHTVASLSSMGLLKQSGAEDMLEVPRYMVGACVSEELARVLAVDCGLDLGRYLKYA